MPDSEDEGLDLFREPEDFYEPAKEATFQQHQLLSGETLRLRLVGFNPLWGHLLWNAGRTVSDYIEASASRLVEERYVLEFGAGAGLPSIVAALKGAAQVVVTDYPDADLVENMRYNCDQSVQSSSIAAEGYLWGAAPDSLTAHLPKNERDQGFHTLILADLLFNHSEHEKLIKSIRETLRRGPECVAIVFFTPYRPWLLGKDMDFFRLASENGFEVEKVLEKVMDKVLFEKDRGDELLRRTVYGYELKWNEDEVTR